jgi:hypothetical protein
MRYLARGTSFPKYEVWLLTLLSHYNTAAKYSQRVSPNLERVCAKDSLASLFMCRHVSIQRQAVSNKIYVPLE